MNIEKIFSMPENKLKDALRNELCGLGYLEGNLHNKKSFLYAEGNAPYMLIAHLDTVHKKLPSIICYSKDGNYMMSPQGIGGDDRCGVYIILELLKKLTFKPYVLFTMGEEIGGIGAKDFSKYICSQNIPSLKYIVEFDRKGNEDCVFYRCGNAEFIEFVESFGFKKEWGTFSDISVIAPDLDVAAVNLSSGYYNPHMEHEYVSINDMKNIIEKSFKMLTSESDSFDYQEVKYEYSYRNRNQKVKVSPVPEDSVFIYNPYADKLYLNMDKELMIDSDGNFYRYHHIYGDLTRMIYEEVLPADDGDIVEFNPETAVELSLYF